MKSKMDRYNDLIIKNTKCPSYLLELLEIEEEIVLVYGKKKNDTLFDTLDDSISLAGSPLEVDLSETLIPNAVSEKYKVEEMQHFPIKFSVARNFINDYNRNKDILNKLNTIYCICDGSQDNIIILGCYLKNGIFARTLVFSPMCVNKLYPQSNISKMIQDHIKNCQVEKPKIDVKVKSLYEVYGYKFNSDNLDKSQNIEFIGSILIEGFWNSSKFHIPEREATINMMLQAIIGHEMSILHNYFKELKFLKQCLNEYSNNGTLEEHITSDDSTNSTLLQNKIYDILWEKHLVKKSVSVHNTLKDVIQSVKETNFTDKLWNVLKCCNKSSDMKDCLDTLYGAINNESRIQICKDDKETKIGKIIEDIYMGRMIGLHLSAKEALGLQIELGLKKMKKKYFSMIKCFNFQMAEQLSNKWNEIGSVFETGGFLELNVSRSLVQLQLLQYTHIVLEFLNLVEQQGHFSKEVTCSVLKHAYNKYITNEIRGESFNLKELTLCDLVLPLTSHIKLINSCAPVEWKLQLTSTINISSVVTVFHYSKKPIFPSVIYNHIDVNKSGEGDEEKYFVTRLEKYSDKLFK